MILKNFKSSREDLDLKQKDLAEFFNLHYSTISGWETGKDTVAKKLNTSQAAYSHYETATNIIPTIFIYGLTKIYKPFSIDTLFGRKKIK